LDQAIIIGGTVGIGTAAIGIIVSGSAVPGTIGAFALGATGNSHSRFQGNIAGMLQMRSQQCEFVRPIQITEEFVLEFPTSSFRCGAEYKK
jgi:hypothetical protein